MQIRIIEVQVGGYPADLVVLDDVAVQNLVDLAEVLPQPRPGRGIVFQATLPIWAAMAAAHHCHRLTWLGCQVSDGVIVVVESHCDSPRPGEVLR